jgi:hypothetical protein
LEEIFGFSTLDIYYFCSSNIKQNGGISMKKRYVSIMMCIAVVASFFFFITAAPHDFGGRRAQAIADCDKALKQLREALKYRISKTSNTKVQVKSPLLYMNTG